MTKENEGKIYWRPNKQVKMNRLYIVVIVQIGIRINVWKSLNRYIIQIGETFENVGDEEVQENTAKVKWTKVE